MILVTGANGHLGRGIVEHLLERIPGREIAVSVREPAKASALAERGVIVREGDFARPETLERAFAGATQVLLVSSNAMAYGGDTMAQHRTAIAAAVRGGVRRVVYTAHQGAAAASAFIPCQGHAETEELLRASGLAWTSLRNGFYASSALDLHFNAALEGGNVVETPADGKASWTDRDDLAAAAAAVLLDEGRFEGPTPPLTASRSFDFAEMAAIASEVLGRRIERKVISDDEFRARITARGAPPTIADLALSTFLAARKGEFDVVDPTLERLIGRPPKTMREMIASAGTR